MVSTTQRERSDQCGVRRPPAKSASEMLIITSPITTIRKIVLPPFGGIEGGLSAPGSAIAARSEGTKTEAKLRLIARGERSVTPGVPSPHERHLKDAKTPANQVISLPSEATFIGINYRGLR